MIRLLKFTVDIDSKTILTAIRNHEPLFRELEEFVLKNSNYILKTLDVVQALENILKENLKNGNNSEGSLYHAIVKYIKDIEDSNRTIGGG